MFQSWLRYLEPRFPSLGKKIALAIIVVSLVSGSVFVYLAQRTGYSVLQLDARAKAHDLALMFQGVLENAMMEGNQKDVAKIMGSVGRSQDVFDAALLRRDGTVCLDGQGNPVNARFPIESLLNGPDSTSPRFLSVKEQNTAFEWVMLPVITKAECRSCHPSAPALEGYIAMKVEVSGVQTIATAHRAVNIFMAIFTFAGLGGIIYYALSILVIRPLGTLHSHIRGIETQLRQMGEGEHAEFSLMPDPPQHDEIADLTRDFNGMVERLNLANKRIFELHQGQLEYADRLKSTGEMAAGLAHEIKNPIAGVIGALQVFEGDMTPDDPKREILTEMLVQLDRVNHTITDLLQYARPTAPILEPIRINELLQKTISLLSQQVKNRKVIVRSELDSANVEVLADRKQFQQVVWNVLLNAIQAIDGEGAVTVRSRANKGMVTVEISDTGRGISPEHLEKIFRPFFTTKHKGTGLGMTISKRIVELHNGRLGISSELGKGTTTTIEIPVHTPPLISRQAETAHPL